MELSGVPIIDSLRKLLSYQSVCYVASFFQVSSLVATYNLDPFGLYSRRALLQGMAFTSLGKLVPKKNVLTRFYGGSARIRTGKRVRYAQYHYSEKMPPGFSFMSEINLHVEGKKHQQEVVNQGDDRASRGR